jgi:hypothetical protein
MQVKSLQSFIIIIIIIIIKGKLSHSVCIDY